ncbi:hypothetical protein BMT55_05265 [Listeria newyorkensis]|uniref:DUF1033 family protein n=1 Tax=Listeria newyorkensis TaxID=1497681 RepID=A0ABX4XQD2_9LIST|nr:DUF1033 family protein [Listeria newyorkensis]KGL40124.1 hypothetical protein EP58_13295 [Listeria newyorkensis]KMT63495.1 hypothetical protein X559_0060 [Listeria newyorkensis]PNP93404.1 hypothetical protein BMT55_05265 [Listeria newyorkensis]WAO21149.1 DUF1033 family protein [Listeria newyorkensis]SQC55813.1 Uncharacterized protein conserved in bacteria [Listeria newyorkensis]
MTKFQVIVTKGEYEPWWFFEDWQKDIESSFVYTEKNDAMLQYQALAQELMANYPNKAVKKNVLLATWSEDETQYCEECDDDIQTFHGLILFADERVYEPTPDELATYFSLEEKLNLSKDA